MSFKRLMIMLAVLVAVILLSIGGLAASSMKKLNDFQANSTAEASFYTKALNDSRQAQVDFQRQVQEWKNILIRGNDPDMYKKYLAGFEDRESRVQNNLKALQKEMAKKGIPFDEAETLLEEHDKLGKIYRNALATYDGADPETGKKVDLMLRGIDRPASQAMDEVAEKIETMSTKKLEEIKVTALAFSQEVMGFFLIASLALLLCAMALCWKIASLVLGKVGVEPAELEAAFQKISKGDLTVNLKVRKGDNSSVAANAQMMVMRMRSMVRAVKNNADEVSTSSESVEMGADMDSVQVALRKAKIAIHGLEQAVGRFNA